MVFQKATRCLLYVNCVWDIVSALAIAGGHETIARWHTGMWSSKKDQGNRAAKSLMAWFVLTLGTARMAAAFYPGSYHACGIVSYVIEGLFALVGFMDGSIKPMEGAAVAISSFAMATCLLGHCIVDMIYMFVHFGKQQGDDTWQAGAQSLASAHHGGGLGAASDANVDISAI